VGAAVLGRALEPLEGVALRRLRRPRARRDADLTNGPGKLCGALGITGAASDAPLDRLPLVLRAGPPIADDDVLVSPRIGITRAAEWPLRFFLRGSAYVSATPRSFFQRPFSS
jgi:DNA-3-methyladenine glycosylase